jgi:acyl-CoA thioesterase-1
MYPFIIALVTLLFFSCTKEEALQESAPTPTPVEIKFLALGDSYTIGQSVGEAQRWPNLLARKMNNEKGIITTETNIIATTGWTTGNLINGINAATPATDYDLVSLLIGVNNQYQGRPISEYRQEFEQLLQTAIAHANGDTSKVFVVSIPDYGYTPVGASNQLFISSQIDQFNAVNLEITEDYGVQYIDITPISREGLIRPELVAPDNLHPSAQQYAEWIELMAEDVSNLVLQ